MYPIEALLSARLYISPQRVGARLYFISNQSGHLSLYVMDATGSIPEPLLPPQIALQNPELIGGASYAVFPKIGQILVMVDRDGDERYRPMLLPIDGGTPEPLLREVFDDKRSALLKVDEDRLLVYLHAQATTEAMNIMYRVDLGTGAIIELGRSVYGCFLDNANADHTRAIVTDGYGPADNVLYEWREGQPERQLLIGVPLEARTPGEPHQRLGIGDCQYVAGDTGLLCTTSQFSDLIGLAYLDLSDPATQHEVTIAGTRHSGVGELERLHHVRDDRYRLTYNIDGATWVYEGTFDLPTLMMQLDTVVCGQQAPLTNGKLEAIQYDQVGDRYALAFPTATSPCQIYTVAGSRREQITQHTRERILGISQDLLSAGEDASFTTYDGLRVSARLYLPAPRLQVGGPYPLVYYIHGGPQGQERPDFTWFSMPLIQFLTLNGFAVFVPNVRGSTGYGMDYMHRVERDWGGADRLDHVHAMTQVLPRDSRLDVAHAGVIGRSYGGYMTLTLAGRHPELWSAAVDMFGPYDLLTFIDRVPATWKPFFALTVGDPAKDRDFLIERSPRTYIDQIRCPMLVIQGQNDPRVIERESRDVVEHLRETEKAVEYIVFPDEGHDVLKFANRVRCYTAITQFFGQRLRG